MAGKRAKRAIQLAAQIRNRYVFLVSPTAIVMRILARTLKKLQNDKTGQLYRFTRYGWPARKYIQKEPKERLMGKGEQRINRLDALVWKAKQLGISYGELSAQLSNGETEHMISTGMCFAKPGQMDRRPIPSTII